MSTKPTHGGRREGAGRPKLRKGAQRVHITARVKPETRAALVAQAEAGAVSVGTVLDQIVSGRRDCS